LDPFRPFIGLERLEPAAFLEIADEQDLARARLSRVVGAGEILGGAHEGVSELRRGPSGRGRGQPADGLRDAVAGGRRLPLVEREERRDDAVESQ
jgi:hypothetical protein